MLIAVDEESLINSDIANRRKHIMDAQLIDKLGKKTEHQAQRIEQLEKALRICRDTAYQSTQDCPRCGFIDKILTQALEQKEGEE